MWREPLYIARQTALGEKEQALWIDYGYETESTAGGVIPDDTLSSSPDNSKQASDWRTVSSPLHLPCFGRRQLINTRVIIGIAPLAVFTETLRPLPPVSRAYGANWTGSPNDVKERFVNSFFWPLRGCGVEYCALQEARAKSLHGLVIHKDLPVIPAMTSSQGWKA